MRRALASLTLALAAAGVVAGPAAAQDPLPLRRVLLSTGGVGYFEHEAVVDGDATLPLSVRLAQVDDVLKSLVVHDERGGVGTVSLPGREPLDAAFRDLPFGREALASPVALLRALAGAEVRVAGARAIEGRLLAVTPEDVALPGGLGKTTRHRVSVVVAGDGVQQFVLEEADRVELVDPTLRRQVGDALAAIARHRVQDRRTLDVALRGAGRRTVRVGYVVEAPLWKTSYRLTVPEEGGAGRAAARRGLLQGWAVLENLSGLPWAGVEVTLVSGNPVTFRQALYRAYHVQRPEVPVEVMGRVLPGVDTGVVREALPARPAPPVGAPAPAAPPPAAAARRVEAPPPASPPAAEVEEATTQVMFRLPAPVTLASGHSLVVPIASREVPVERLALVDPRVSAAHPLAAVRLRNETGASLPPGVLTLYERGAQAATAYVGDARLGPLPAGESRLLSFAVDGKTHVAVESQAGERVAGARLSRGLLHLTTVDRQTTRYRLKAPAQEARAVLIEHPRRADWRLVAPPERDVELTRDHYRVPAALGPGEARVVEVTVERPRDARLVLADLTPEALAGYARTGALDERVRKAFETLAGLRQDIEREQRAVTDAEAARAAIHAEQERLRANLARVPATSDLHQRYLDLLRQQEDQLQALARELREAQARRRTAQDKLAEAIAKLEL